jgi:acyl-CoA synthetase (AMP-forming)/AMP-acid ligase II
MRLPLTVADFLDRAVQVYPERTALVDEPGVAGSLGRITYAELAGRARCLAEGLQRLGVPRGGRVAIVSPNSGRFLTAFFGVSAYGRVLVPINYRLQPEEIGYIVEHSGAEVLLVDPDQESLTAGLPVRHRIVLDGQADAELFGDHLPPEQRRTIQPTWAAPLPGEEDAVVEEDDTCSINYTSGTTARPKGVQLTHRNCWLNAVVLGWHTQLSDRDRYLHTLPMFHCNGWGMPYGLTGMGCPQVVQRKVDGEQILQRVEQEGVTLLSGAPAVVAAILGAAAARLERGEALPGRDRVRMVVAGAPPPSRVIERLETELGWEFIQIYGLTETSPLLTVNRAPVEWAGLDSAERARRLSRAGTPAVGVRLQLAPDGEVLAQANHVFAGYWRQPEASAEALAGGWFHTGDGGHFEVDGPENGQAAGRTSLVISDRKKDVIITGGENVSSIEVEDCLYQHPAVAEAAVIGVPDERWGETVKALVVLKDGATATPEDLIAHCRDRLAHFKCPTSVELRESLPRTATGKLQKFKLRAEYWAGRDRLVN